MGLLTALIGPPAASPRRERRAGLEDPNTPLGAGDDSEYGGGYGGAAAKSGVRVTPRRALGFSPWWRGVTLVSGTVGKLPLAVCRRDGANKSPDPGHPAYQLLRHKPSGASRSFNLLAFDFKRLLTAHAMTRGNGYAYVERAGPRPVALLPLNPDETFAARVNGVLWYVNQTAGRQTLLRPDEVLHVKGPGFDGLTGYNVLHLHRETLGLPIAARQYGSVYFANDATPRLVIEHPANLSKPAQERLLASWDNTYRGLDNAHKAAILEEGMKAHPLSFNAQDSQLIATLKLSIIEIANVVGVPPHKLGETTRTSHASLEQENVSYLDDSIDPWLVPWEEECRDKLLTEGEKRSESHEVEFDRKALLRTDTLTRRRANSIAVMGGWMSPDQAAADEGWNPLPGGRGGVFYRPMNMAADDVPAAPAGKAADLLAIAESVSGGLVPPEAAKVMIAAAFPMMGEAEVDAMVQALGRVGPPPVIAVKPAAPAPKQLPAPDPAPARAALDAQRRRMAKRVGRCARRAAKKPETFLAWLASMPDEHRPVVTEALAPAVAALAAVESGNRSAEQEADLLLSRWRAVLVGAAVETAGRPAGLARRVDQVMGAEEAGG